MTHPPFKGGPNARFLAWDGATASGPSDRFGNAVGASAAAHVVLFVVVVVIMQASLSEHRRVLDPPLAVWLPTRGAGGGGSGNDHSAPARLHEARGKDTTSLPVARPSEQNRVDHTKIDHSVDVPAVATVSGIRELPGVLTDLTVISIGDSQGPGTGGRSGDGHQLGNGSGDGPGLGSGRRSGVEGDGYTVGNGVLAPRLIREVKPGYTSEALRARIQGVVVLRTTILPDGSVGGVRVVRSLDRLFGLDDEAVKTVKLWRFTPGTLAGRAVAVVVDVELTFTLR
jgi:protein TonB